MVKKAAPSELTLQGMNPEPALDRGQDQALRISCANTGEEAIDFQFEAIAALRQGIRPDQQL